MSFVNSLISRKTAKYYLYINIFCVRYNLITPFVECFGGTQMIRIPSYLMCLI